MAEFSELSTWKVVDPSEMARIEKKNAQEGGSIEEWMFVAGSAVARHALELIHQNRTAAQAFLLIGKGNKGGDAYVAGCELIKKGVQATALALYPNDQCSPLNLRQHKRFAETGGRILFASEKPQWDIPDQGILIDGLVGTGFRGRAEGELAHAIAKANHSDLPILAIDIPSGLDGSDGSVETVAIKAARTITMQLPKMGFFLREGWNHVGALFIEDIGMDPRWIQDAHARALMPKPGSCKALLPPLVRNRHKYQAGYVLALAGSRDMPGAAFLSTLAALRSGAGIVRLFHNYEMYGEMSGAPLELVREGWDLKHFDRLHEEAHRASSILVGPGLGREKRVRSMLKTLFKEFHLPFVIDADALFFLAGNSDWTIPSGSVLTPHRAEMKRLLRREKDSLSEEKLLTLCQEYATDRQTTLVVKGAPTWIVYPGQIPLVMTRGNPGMATAGSGDVLTGMIAAFLAQKLPALHAAILAVYLHGLSGEHASRTHTPYSMVASDLIAHLGDAFHSVYHA